MNDKINDVLTTKKTVFGFHVADLLGIALMVIPCLISLMHFPWFEKAVSWLPGWVPFRSCIQKLKRVVSLSGKRGKCRNIYR